jgi:Tfp pilus assembly protein PilE
MHNTTPTSTTWIRSLAHERGIGVIEVVIVMLLIAMIGGIAVQSLRGTKRSTASTKGRTLALSLSEGIEQFQRDHGGRLPGDPGTADWGRTWLSPVDASNGNKPYVRQSAIESLVDGGAALQNNAGRAARGNPTAAVVIQYRSDVSAGSYALVVKTRTGSTYKSICRVTNASGSRSAAFRARLGVTQPC